MLRSAPCRASWRKTIHCLCATSPRVREGLGAPKERRRGSPNPHQAAGRSIPAAGATSTAVREGTGSESRQPTVPPAAGTSPARRSAQSPLASPRSRLLLLLLLVPLSIHTCGIMHASISPRYRPPIGVPGRSPEAAPPTPPQCPHRNRSTQTSMVHSPGEVGGGLPQCGLRVFLRTRASCATATYKVKANPSPVQAWPCGRVRELVISSRLVTH